MVKKLAVCVLFFGALVYMPAPAHAEDSVTVEQSVDTSVATPGEEEVLPVEEGVGEGVLTGDVTALDAAQGSITVKASDGLEKAFSVVEGETILWKGIEDIKLSDIKTGDKAEVGYYTDDSGKLIASWVDVIIPETSADTGALSEPQAAPAVSGEGEK